MTNFHTRIIAEAIIESKIGLREFKLESSPDFEFEEVLQALHELGCHVRTINDHVAEIRPPHRGRVYEQLIAL